MMLEPLAEKGDHGCQFALGELYRKAKFDVDPQDGVQLYLAAKKGLDSPAMPWAGCSMRPGGLKGFQMAAEGTGWRPCIGGHGEAQFDLGTLYFNGRGVPHDYGDACGPQGGPPGPRGGAIPCGAMTEEGWRRAADPVEAYA